MRFFIIFLFIMGINAGHITHAYSATPRPSRTTSNSTTQKSANVRVRSATTSQKTISGRRTPKTNSPTKGVVARAANTQKVVSTGTKVATATQNTAINQSCADKYNGCMDSLCMVENTSGGRCLCSNKISEYNKTLSEIELMDVQSYELATVGVESIEVGVDIVAQKRTTTPGTKENLLSLWDTSDDTDATNTKPETTGDALRNTAHNKCTQMMPDCASEISTLAVMYNAKIRSDCAAYENYLKQLRNDSQKKQDAALSAVRNAALGKIQESNKYDLGTCAVEFKKCMITTGGCGDDFSKCATLSAMENTNSRVKSRSASQKYQINGAVTSIEIHASTYDTLMAKKPLCDTVTKQCSAVADKVWDVFIGDVAPQLKTAELIAENNARQNCAENISNCFQRACKETMDPKDPDGSYDMCLTRPDTMLNVCKVPLNACGIDATNRQSAEKSGIWEFILARLAAMRADACTIEVKECLTHVDRCGPDYTACVGLDTDTIVRMCPYDAMVGCQKVYGDVDIRGDAVYDALSNLVQGIFLSIDNKMLEQCQRAADAAMVRICGDTQNCNSMTINETIGTNSLEYKICNYNLDNNNNFSIDYNACRSNIDLIPDSELGRGAPITPMAGIIDGTIYWGLINYNPETGLFTGADEYFNNEIVKTASVSDNQRKRIASEINNVQNNVDSVIKTIESDPTVQYCMTGRQVPGLKDDFIGNGTARFPQLTKQMRNIIATHVLKTVQENYFKLYDELNERLLTDRTKISERISEIAGENAKDARRESARQSCVALAEMSAMPKSSEPPKMNAAGIALISILIAAAIVVACVFTAGAALGGVGVLALGLTTTTTTVSTTAAITTTATTIAGTVAGTVTTATSLSAAGIAAATIGAGAAAGAVAAGAVAGAAGNANGQDVNVTAELTGHFELDQWNYKEKITTTFDWENLNCTKCTVTQNCAKTKSPMFGKKKCKDWESPVEECRNIQF